MVRKKSINQLKKTIKKYDEEKKEYWRKFNEWMYSLERRKNLLESYNLKTIKYLAKKNWYKSKIIIENS